MTNHIHGFLLLSVHSFDDIPIQFYPTKKEAKAGIRRRQPPRHNCLRPTRPNGTEVIDSPFAVLNHQGWKILEFRNGKPKGHAQFVEAA